MKTWRLAFITLLAFLVIETDLYLFKANLFAIGWHLRHGFHQQINGFRIRVPLFFEPSEGDMLNQLSMDSFASPVHRGRSSINIDFPPWSSARLGEMLALEDGQGLGLTPIGQRAARFADRQGNCMEFRWNLRSLDPRPPERDPLRIICRFGDIIADFDGTREETHEFYMILSSAKRVEH